MNIAFFIRALCWVSIVTWIMVCISCIRDQGRWPYVTTTPRIGHTIAAIIAVVALLTL